MNLLKEEEPNEQTKCAECRTIMKTEIKLCAYGALIFALIIVIAYLTATFFERNTGNIYNMMLIVAALIAGVVGYFFDKRKYKNDN